MKTQHTPGPWHISECATQNTLAGICSESGLHITDISGYGQTEEQNQANARLIASAPTMFDYLTLLASRGNDEAHEIIKKITGP